MKKTIEYKDFINKNKKIIFKHENKQILLIGIEGEIYALDNKCPHEGYPLSQGTIDEKKCQLTCQWHNWSFDLKTGKNSVGGDNVALYPVEVIEDKIIVNLSKQPINEVKENILKGLKTAFEKRQYGRIARELTKLTSNKIDPLLAIKEAIYWSYEKFEFGTTHALATTADWIQLYKKYNENEDKIICLTEALDHLSFDSLRQPDFKYTHSHYSDMKIVFTKESLLSAILNEDSKLAESLCLKAFDKGLRFKDLKDIFIKSAFSHYQAFGHSLIYILKMDFLSNEFDSPDIDKAISLPLVRHFCYSTKEDKTPQFKKYQETVTTLKQNKFLESSTPVNSLSYKFSLSQSYNWLITNQQNHSPKDFYQEILRACADSLLHFDIRFQEENLNPVKDNVNWLDFTHGITFTNAVRKICEQYPQYWEEGLVQMLCFLGRNSLYTTDSIKKSDWDISTYELESFAYKKTLDHGLSHPIYSAHILKTTLAVFEEIEKNNEEVSSYLRACLNRFLNSSMKQKYARRTVVQAMKLIGLN